MKTSLFYQQLMFYTKKMNDEKIRIYRQKVKSFYYLAIITWSNITKIVFELACYLTNLNSNYVKTVSHCIKYLHAIKYLAIRYSNSKDEKLSSQISSSNKKTTLSLSNEMKSSHSKLNKFSHSKLNRITSSKKNRIISKSLKKQRMHFLQMILIEEALKVIFSNFLMIWSTELQENNS